VGLEGIDVVTIRSEDTFGLDTLAEAVLANKLDDLLAVLLLGVYPAGHLVEVLGVHGSTELVDLYHSLTDGGSSLLDLGDELGVVEDAAGNLAVTATETEHEVKSGFLLDVVIGEGAAVLELLAGEDEALLIRGNALLVLNLLLDVVDGVRRLDVEGDGLASEGLDENLDI
jgi:hypothetical protein